MISICFRCTALFELMTYRNLAGYLKEKLSKESGWPYQKRDKVNENCLSNTATKRND